eukprot:CAMPEP_0178897926 /NCGR_PEP_ID=MMETSP0786-20121207/2030_1 /TAXON_ID=186022 /ORGANISM="Thalassionema frauenfeldii, Strain CCMP 1798" /LENGTH=233 /DNA_ID=CAMNT_0020568555 /DNA_START=96 /DNA_END=797 /DNA_ORIENTATION=-
MRVFTQAFLIGKSLRQEALKAGERIQNIIGPKNSVIFYVSPYYRTRQTFEEVKKKITAEILFVREEPRLREQDFGNFQDKALMQESKEERVKFGRFFYRFPNGESGADVFDRVSAFCGTLLLDMSQIKDPNVSVVFITHGITARLFVKKWLHWTVDDFEGLHNPPNCGLLHLERVGYRENTAFRLTKESRDLIKAPAEEGIGRGLKLGRALLERRKKNQDSAWDRLPDTAWGV